MVGSNIRVKDSEVLLDVFLGESNKGRENLILEASTKTALRQGDWVMIPPCKGPAINKFVNIELGNSKEYQLYNLKDDIGQKNNLAEVNKEKLQELVVLFEYIRGKEYNKIQQLKLK